ncbi:MAG TPA: hypothetical protein VIY68_18625 [Steroidobacteraceae bacterium]
MNRRAPVQDLASTFHQDFKVMGIEPEEWGKEFVPLSEWTRMFAEHEAERGRAGADI